MLGLYKPGKNKGQKPMISDILSDAIDEIRRYQREMPNVYDDIKPKIEKVVAVMDGLRAELDTPPAS